MGLLQVGDLELGGHAEDQVRRNPSGPRIPHPAGPHGKEDDVDGHGRGGGDGDRTHGVAGHDTGSLGVGALLRQPEILLFRRGEDSERPG